MKKNPLNLLILICLILVPFTGLKAHEEPPKTAKEKKEAERKRLQRVKHKVKTISAYSNFLDNGVKTGKKRCLYRMDVDTSGLIESISEFDVNDSLKAMVMQYYDNRMLMIHDVEYNKNMKAEGRGVFEFSGQGCILRIVEFGKGLLPEQVVSYDYDVSGGKVIMTSYNKAGLREYTIEYFYPAGLDTGVCTSVVKRSADGKIEMKVENVYNEAGRRIEKKILNARNEIEYTYTYTYTGEGEFKVISKHSPAGNLISTDTYTYNEKGLLISVVTEKPDGRMVSWNTFEYSFYE